MSQYNLKVARKYHFVTGCKEHQSFTYLESNGYDMSPLFYSDFKNIYPFLQECLQKGDFTQNFEEDDFWNKAKSFYGIQTCSGNIHQEQFNSVHELYAIHNRPIFVSADSFFIPYSSNFRKENIGTRLSILGVTEDSYSVGDSQHYLITQIERGILDEAALKGQGASGNYCVPYFGEEADPYNICIFEIPELLSTHAEILIQQRLDHPENDVLIGDFINSHIIYEAKIIPKLNEYFIAWYAVWQKTKMFLAWCIEQSSKIVIDPKVLEQLDKLIAGWQRVQIEYNKGIHQKLGLSDKLKDRLLNIRQIESALAENYLQFTR